MPCRRTRSFPPGSSLFQRFESRFDGAAGAVLRDGELGSFERELSEADALLFEKSFGAVAQLAADSFGARSLLAA